MKRGGAGMQHSKLRGLIAERGIRQNALAKAFGISTQALNKKLNGTTKTTVDDAVKFCDILRITDNETKCEIFLTSPSQN